MPSTNPTVEQHRQNVREEEPDVLFHDEFLAECSIRIRGARRSHACCHDGPHQLHTAMAMRDGAMDLDTDQ